MATLELTETELRDLYTMTMTGDSDLDYSTPEERVAAKRALRKKLLAALGGA